MRSLAKFFGYVSGLVVISMAPAFADQPNLTSGSPPNSSFSGSDVDKVNLMNGQLLVTLPLPIASPQRGGKLNFNFMLTANSVPWAVKKLASNNPGCIPQTAATGCWTNKGDVNADVGNLDGGVGLVRGWDISVHRTVIIKYGASGSITSERESNHFLMTFDGATHHLQNVSANGLAYFAVDNSGYQIILSNPDSYGLNLQGTVVDRHGNRYAIIFNQITSFDSRCSPASVGTTSSRTCQQGSRTTSVTDTNGNVYTLPNTNFSGVDTKDNVPPTGVAGTAITAACYSHAGLPIASTSAIGYPGYKGTTQSITLCYATYTLKTSFGQGGIEEYQTNSNTLSANPNLMVTAVLPDGSKYTFDYDSYGNLTYIGLPLGGSISYGWSTFDPAFGPCGNPAQFSRVLTTRTLSDANGNSYTWNYSYGELQSNGMTTTTVTDSNSNDTEHVFSTYTNTAAGGVPGATACQGLVEVISRAYQGTGQSRTRLAETDIVYVAAAMPNAETTNANELTPIVGNVFPNVITTYNSPTGKVMKVVRTPDTGFGNGGPTLGQAVTEKVYDWGSGTPGPLVKETDTAYMWQSDSRYANAGLLDLAASITIKDGSGNQAERTTYSYDNPANLYPSNITLQHIAAPNPVRGNISSISNWLNTRTATPITVPTNVYDTGVIYNSIQPTDTAGDRRTIFKYDTTGIHVIETDLPSTTNAVFSGRPSIVHVIKASYDFNTGLVTSTTDQNGNVATFDYDNMNRPTRQTNPDGGVVTFGVAGAGAVLANLYTSYFIGSIDSTSDLNSLVYIHNADTTYDGLGRPILSRTLVNGLADSARSHVATSYDGAGRALTVTNPYYTTSDTTYGTSSMQYDALGRTIRVTKPDGSVGTTTYDQSVTGISGLCILVTDEAGKSRETCSDALGRTTAILEDPNNLKLETDYAYTSSSGSQQVTITQKGEPGTASSQYRVHTSVYDSLGRLLSASNPETGTIFYTYDDNGNLTTKTDANNVQTIYSYDQDNRLIQATPTDNSIGTYLLYDYNSVGPISIRNPVGRVVASTTPGGTRWFVSDYDSMGRTLQRTQCSGDANGNISLPTCGGEGQTYDYIGDVTQRTYLTGYQVNYTYDEAGRVLSAKDSNGYQFANNIDYEASGSVAAIPTPNFAYNYAYNNRFQPTQIAVGSLTTTLMFKDYAYHPGNNNGNVVSVTNETDAADSAAFAYDGLNRLVCAQAGVTTTSTGCVFGKGAWGNTYSYDDWGNLTAKINSGGAGESVSETIGANNRIMKYTNQAGVTLTPTYDNAGNITNDGETGYAFDEWNRLTNTTAGNVINVYGPGGERWSKSSTSENTFYWYGPQGEVLAEQKAGIYTYYVYLGSTRLARVQSNNGTNALSSLTDIKFYLTDALGTTNKLVDKDGKTIVDSQDFFPFGAVVPGVGQVTSTNHYKFTGQERDAETGLDNFGARYYSSALGRWISADWSAAPTSIPYANANSPQSFNLYRYAGNNPSTLRDPDGHLLDGFNLSDPFAGGRGFTGGSWSAGGSLSSEGTATGEGAIGYVNQLIALAQWAVDFARDSQWIIDNVLLSPYKTYDFDKDYDFGNGKGFGYYVSQILSSGAQSTGLTDPCDGSSNCRLTNLGTKDAYVAVIFAYAIPDANGLGKDVTVTDKFVFKSNGLVDGSNSFSTDQNGNKTELNVAGFLRDMGALGIGDAADAQASAANKFSNSFPDSDTTSKSNMRNIMINIRNLIQQGGTPPAWGPYQP